MMKKILPVALALAFTGCYSSRDIQVRPTFAEVVKIDTIHRQSNSEELLLTWKTEDNIEYISFEPVTWPYNLGSKMQVLVRR